tara:strand:+ start:722 stop:2935 length:2214 start_codon:yes stop_codon:yes gene_type:complete
MLDQSKTYAYNSKKISAGDSYICLPKGEAYIEEALQNGATDVIHLNRKEFAESAKAYFDDPTKKVKLIGITGTNGKTSVAYFTEQFLSFFGHKVLNIGTINSSLTTPESWDILKQIKDHVENGGTHVVLEVSSHGIDQFRVYGFDFDVKCLTNITQDHLDYHGSFDEYKRTKMHFMNDYPGHAIFSDLIQRIDPNMISQLKGSFHLMNVSCAIEICKKLGCSTSDLHQYLDQLKAPQGRFQSVVAGQPFTVIVDFAHTPDALDQVLKDASHIVANDKNRLTVVFGCGGDRDRGKRSKMGAIAETYSANIFLTADNSRSEATLTIIEDIKESIPEDSLNAIHLNRADAIAQAIAQAQSNELILIAGKGHETVQVCNGYSYVFNDYDVAFSEIIRQQKFQAAQSWVLNEPDEKADVLFISKKIMSLLKITYSQFKRALPTPSNAKIKDYLSKINGQKILVLEGEKRTSVSELLMRVFREFGEGQAYLFDNTKSLEYNLIGLTLIEQTSEPLIIQIDPNYFGKINKIIEVIAPNYVIAGDLYNQHGFVDPAIIKSFQAISKHAAESTMFWFFDQMVDINDSLPEGLNIRPVHAANWIEYTQSLIEELLIKLDLYNYSPRDIIFRYLLSTSWILKVNIEESKIPIYIVDWTEDIIDAIQKIKYFINSQNVFHYVWAPQKLHELIAEINRNPNIPSEHVIELNADGKDIMDAVKTSLNTNPDAVHIFWKTTADSLSLFERMK